MHVTAAVPNIVIAPTERMCKAQYNNRVSYVLSLHICV